MIPNVAHFIWYGQAFPWSHELAIRSSLLRGGVERAVLHHDAVLDLPPALRELEAAGSLQLRPIDAAAFSGLGELAAPLAALHAALRAPAARANLLRVAILLREGGVYLDMDTVSIASLEPLRAVPAFCGVEHVAYPAQVMASRDKLRLARGLTLSTLRDGCRRMPDGWRLFRRIEGLFPLAANNAVMGAVPGHPFIAELAESMLRLSVTRQHQRFALGTHLLQDTLRTRAGRDVTLHPPQVFYPLGPEISQQWFRTTRRPDLEGLLSSQTRVVHWYASVRNNRAIARVEPHRVRERRHREPFSALVYSRLPEVCA